MTYKIAREIKHNLPAESILEVMSASFAHPVVIEAEAF